jgi:hypothetical protein
MLTLTLTLAACSPPGPFTTVRDTGALSDTAPSTRTPMSTPRRSTPT